MAKKTDQKTCDRCRAKIGVYFYEIMDTVNNKKKILCFECGLDFKKWWTNKKTK